MSLVVPLSRQIECVEREIKQRRRVYGGMVERGAMTPLKAKTEIEVMGAVLETLRKLQEKEMLL